MRLLPTEWSALQTLGYMYLLGLTKKKGKLGELNQNSMIQVGRSDSIIAWGHDEGKLDSTSSNKKSDLMERWEVWFNRLVNVS